MPSDLIDRGKTGKGSLLGTRNADVDVNEVSWDSEHALRTPPNIVRDSDPVAQAFMLYTSPARCLNDVEANK